MDREETIQFFKDLAELAQLSPDDFKFTVWLIHVQAESIQSPYDHIVLALWNRWVHASTQQEKQAADEALWWYWKRNVAHKK